MQDLTFHFILSQISHKTCRSSDLENDYVYVLWGPAEFKFCITTRLHTHHLYTCKEILVTTNQIAMFPCVTSEVHLTDPPDCPTAVRGMHASALSLYTSVDRPSPSMSSRVRAEPIGYPGHLPSF